MIQSMTGFAHITFVLTAPSGEKTSVAISLKSLNYRFFETTFKLPYTLSHLETKLIKLCKKKLVRGHVYLTIHLSNPSLFRGNIEPALNTIQNYINAINTIRKTHNIKQEITLDQVLQLPNIFAVEEIGSDEEIEQKIIDTIEELIDRVVQAREQEGQALKKDIQERIAIMQKEIDVIETLSQQLIETHKEKVQKALAEITHDESSLAQARQEALYAMLDKLDIHEEIIRFKSHIKSLREQLDSPQIEKGKRLDFTLQELGREINTITAKCSDAQISTRAINVKVEIEKAREQTQNIV
ncbi:MAG TPA: YicC family protein [Candidatus Dependentiae bacterium]|nr:YicC family protein [Candidatus Dependentiae bacterium]HRQ62406.1 YicC family protein [Candidatus Dependentiae bacterium]